MGTVVTVVKPRLRRDQDSIAARADAVEARRMKALLASLALVAGGAAGCGGSGSGLHTMGMLGVPSPALIGSNVVFVDAALNGHAGGRLLIDTGSPYTLIDPQQFPGATLPPQQEVNADIGLGALTIDAVPSLQITTGTMDSLHLGGILGANVLRQFSTEVNYRDQELRLGDGAAPADVEIPGASVPFKLEGGTSPLDTSGIPAPTTRVPVTVTLEGTPHPFILDTGASEVTVRAALFATLTADGRARLSGLTVSTATGQASAIVSRLRTVSAAGQDVSDVAFMTLNDDTLLDSLASEVHHPIDGLLGGSFLREFLVTIDYPRGELHLQRYGTRDHISDEFQRVGIQLEASGASYAVGVVYQGSDAAAKGLRVGDQIVAIDGQALTALNPIAADQLLQGPVGGTHRLSMGVTAAVALTFTDVVVRVDDLIPPPAP